MVRRLWFVTLVLFSSGWVVPVYFAFQWLVQWCRVEVAPAINGQERQLNSFPYLAEAERWWAVASVWLALVAIFWSSVGARRLLATDDRRSR